MVSMAQSQTLHASVVLVGAGAVLIRGPSGSGKSHLVLSLIQAAQAGTLRFARLVADDRAELTAAHGRLLARAPATLAGLLEVRGLGIRRLDYESVALVSLAVDLMAEDAARLPAVSSQHTEIHGVRLPRLPVASGKDPLPLVLCALTAGTPAI